MNEKELLLAEILRLQQEQLCVLSRIETLLRRRGRTRKVKNFERRKEIIAALRILTGTMTQKTIAATVGVTPAALSLYLSGKSSPREDIRIRILSLARRLEPSGLVEPD